MPSGAGGLETREHGCEEKRKGGTRNSTRHGRVSVQVCLSVRIPRGGHEGAREEDLGAVFPVEGAAFAKAQWQGRPDDLDVSLGPGICRRPWAPGGQREQTPGDLQTRTCGPAAALAPRGSRSSAPGDAPAVSEQARAQSDPTARAAVTGAAPAPELPWVERLRAVGRGSGGSGAAVGNTGLLSTGGAH